MEEGVMGWKARGECAWWEGDARSCMMHFVFKECGIFGDSWQFSAVLSGNRKLVQAAALHESGDTGSLECSLGISKLALGYFSGLVQTSLTAVLLWRNCKEDLLSQPVALFSVLDLQILNRVQLGKEKWNGCCPGMTSVFYSPHGRDLACTGMQCLNY